MTTYYLSLVLTPLRIRWTIPLSGHFTGGTSGIYYTLQRTFYIELGIFTQQGTQLFDKSLFSANQFGCNTYVSNILYELYGKLVICWILRVNIYANAYIVPQIYLVNCLILELKALTFESVNLPKLDSVNL
jgi:hypothetical protein